MENERFTRLLHKGANSRRIAERPLDFMSDMQRIREHGVGSAMTKSATDVMHEIILSAVTQSLEALKSASKGMPNTLLRDLNAIHPNAAFADLPRELQAVISTNVRSAFNRLLKEGYSVSQGQPAPARAPSTTSPTPGNRRPPRPEGPRRDGHRPGPRPPRKPKPAGPNKR